MGFYGIAYQKSTFGVSLNIWRSTHACLACIYWCAAKSKNVDESCSFVFSTEILNLAQNAHNGDHS